MIDNDPDRLHDETLAAVADLPEECSCGDDETCTICVPCDICRDGAQECCDGEWDDCPCGGSGYAIPDHCCGCGGSPYCVKCHTCGAECFGACRCPITVQLQSGDTLTL